VCPYCGHDFRHPPTPPAYVEKISEGMKILLYLVSFFIPIIGLIIGFIYYSKQDPEFKNVGKTCILLALIPIIVGIVVLSAILMGILALGWTWPWDGSWAFLSTAA